MSETLCGVIIGGAIGLFGSLILEIFRFIRQKKSEAQKLRIEHIKEKKAEYRFLMETIVKLEKYFSTTGRTIQEVIDNKSTFNDEMKREIVDKLQNLITNFIAKARLMNNKPLIKEVIELQAAMLKDLEEVQIWDKVNLTMVTIEALILKGYKKLDDEILKLSQ
jgi:hypothetical protein